MRLKKVERGHALKERAKLALMRVASRREPVDVIKTLLYRPEFLGATMGRLFQHAMRGPSYWSVGERELMAAFVSSRNQCVF